MRAMCRWAMGSCSSRHLQHDTHVTRDTRVDTNYTRDTRDTLLLIPDTGLRLLHPDQLEHALAQPRAHPPLGLAAGRQPGYIVLEN